MYNSNMKYLTQILDKRLVSPEGAPLGKIVDAVATLGGRFPSVQALVARIGAEEICLPYEALEFEDDPEGPTGSGHIPGDIRLQRELDAITPYQPDNEDL